MRALLFGVTPEYAGMAWPRGTALTAMDKSPTMIERIWPLSAETRPASATVQCVDWLELPLPDASVDVIVSDGCFSQVGYPHEAEHLVRQIRRVLRPSGRLAVRTFVRPASPLSVDAVFEGVSQDRYENFHAFKWCLNMALQPTLTAGVRLGEVWQTFEARVGTAGRRAWAEASGFAVEDVDTIDAYRDSGAIFHYPTQSELHATLLPHLTGVTWAYPAYPLGERCPYVSASA